MDEKRATEREKLNKTTSTRKNSGPKAVRFKRTPKLEDMTPEQIAEVVRRLGNAS